MKLTLEVTPHEGDPYRVTTNLFTVVAWERRYTSKASTLATALGLEDLAFLAYESAKQGGVTVPAVFDDFLKRIESVTVVEQSDANPSSGEPSADL